MKKASWMKGIVVLAVCLTAVGCSDSTGSSSSERELTENFRALVLGGREADSRQDWSTVVSTPVTVSVDMGTNEVYKVYLLESSPLFNSEAAYLGMVCVPSGQQKSITIPRPSDTVVLYAACYDDVGHAVCKPFIVDADGGRVSFEGRRPAADAVFSSSESDAWHVAIDSQPDLTPCSGNEIKGYYEGVLPELETGDNNSVYVSGIWLINDRQRLAPGTTVVVGEGARLAVMPGSSLTAQAGTSVDAIPTRIFVKQGGTFLCNGSVSLADTYVYNEGTFVSNAISLSNVTIANTGKFGNADDSRYPSLLVTSGSASLTNMGQAWLSSVSGSDFTLQNAGELIVTGGLTLTGDSRLDDGSYTECASLYMQGDDSGRVLHMGNAAYLNCLGNAEITNFGVSGPSGDHFAANAVVQLKRAPVCQPCDGLPTTYLLDHVELVIPSNIPLLADYWLNGYCGHLADAANYGWSSAAGKYSCVWTGGGTANGIDASRQTCTIGTSPSFSYGHIAKGAATDVPYANCVYYAFEIPEDNFMDFDYNDVVLRVNAPLDNGDGTITLNVLGMCVGTTQHITLLYNGSPLGEELHAVMGDAVGKTINASSVSRVFSRVGGITLADGSQRIDQLPFSLQVINEKERVNVYSKDIVIAEAPFCIVVSGDAKSRWYWSREGVNIGLAYPRFSNWGTDITSAPQWYRSDYADHGRIVTWTNL